MGETISMIVTGVVFLFLFLLYMGIEIDRNNTKRYNERKLFYYYASENLKKMEYDISSYYTETEKDSDNEVKQVTIEDIISNKEAMRRDLLADICTPIEDEGLKEIIGHYNPDSDS